jgi:hypothetical protein
MKEIKMQSEEGITFEDVMRWAMIILVIGLIVGAIFLVWVEILGPAFNQANYQNFNSSPQHLQAVAGQFSRDCLQLDETQDVTSRKAIEQDIYQASSTVALDRIQISSTTRTCVNTAIADIEG